MDEGHRPWTGAAVLIGVMYAVIGIVFAWPATRVHAWRLAAWLLSGAAFAAHIGYERFWFRNPPRSAALHVASAAALGACGLAVGAIIHSLSVGSSGQHRRLLLIALVAWPIITGVPAFLVALGASELLARLPRRGKV